MRKDIGLKEEMDGKISAHRKNRLSYSLSRSEGIYAGRRTGSVKTNSY